MHVGVVGTGYVGLVTGTCFADLGLQVTCVDQDVAKVEALQRGEIPIFEPGLDVLVAKNTEQGRLSFSTDLEEVVKRSLVVVVAVGTPPREDGTADLSAVEAVARAVGKNLDGYKVIVTKSTVPAGTGSKIRSWIEEESSGEVSFDVASNPEFLREGSAIEDFMRPDRIVVGVESSQAVAILSDLYRPLTGRNATLLITNVETAEVIKYASNAFLATKVSFINEVSGLCEEVGADVREVARGMGLDQRIGKHFLNPGPGYGGSCFPKDTLAFAALGTEHGTPLQIVQAAIDANTRHQERCLEKVLEMLGEDCVGLRVGVLGLSFKPDTDDMRDSPSIPLVRGLLARGVKVRAFDPEAMDNAREMLPEVHYCKDSTEVVAEADLLVLVTEWNEFRALNWEQIGAAMKTRRVVDLRNLYEPVQMKRRGFDYQCVGRPLRAFEVRD
jgi:UDPglucose 6-dehydrogenase